MTTLNNDLPEIQFSRQSVKDDQSEWEVPWKNYTNADITWWYVSEYRDLEGEEDSLAYKEGVALSIHTHNNNFEVMISTEELVEMLRTVVQGITGSPSISLALAEAPDHGLRRIE